MIEPGFPGPPPHHLHEHLHEMFYVLEGTLTMRVGEETIERGPGSFACIPAPRRAHVQQPQRAAGAVPQLQHPAGWEHYLRDLAATLAAGSGSFAGEQRRCQGISGSIC